MKYITKNKVIVGLMLVIVCAVYSACDFEPELPAIVEYPEISITDFSPKSGKPNEMVTITGADFGEYSKAVSVSFGDIIVESIESVSNEEIQVRVPDGVVGTSEVVVKVWTYEKSFGDDEFTTLAGSVIDSIAPATGTIGDIITIYGENFGTVAEDVEVYFSGAVGAVQAEVISVTDTEILVEVPIAISGPLTVSVSPETLETQDFVFPFTGIDVSFDDTDDGWTAQQDATQSLVDGELSVEFAGTQADLINTGTQVIDPSSFPIIAIRMTRLGDFDLEVETDLGVFTGEMGIVPGSADVFYWDLSSAAFSDGTTLDGVTVFDEFRFNITKASVESGYKVDFIKSFTSVDVMKDELSEGLYPLGKRSIEFDYVTSAPSPEWTVDDMINIEGADHRNVAFRQEGGQFIAQYGEDRLGFWYSWRTAKLTLNQAYPEGYSEYLETINGVNANPTAGGGTLEVPNLSYSTEYPIWAIKADWNGKTAVCRFQMEVPSQPWNEGQIGFANAANLALTTLPNHDDVYYLDGRETVEIAAGWATGNVDGVTYMDELGFNGSGGVAVAGTEYTVDWIVSFRSIEELQAYADGHDL